MPQRLREPTLTPTRPANAGELPSLRSWLDAPGQAEVEAAPRPAAPAHPAVNSLLPADGPGFYAYSAAARRFGRPETIQALLAITAAWRQQFPNGPRIGVGSISLTGGGPMPPHRTHQDGLDVDLRPVRGDGREEPVTWRDPAFSRAATQRLVDLLLGNRVLGVQRILFNDPAITGVRAFLGHDNHLHVRFLAPAAGTAPPPPPDAPGPSASPPPAGAARPPASPPPARPSAPLAQALAQTPSPAAPAPRQPASRLGMLVARWPDGRRFRYRFSGADLLVSARLVAGAGAPDGRADGGRLVRMLLRRYARSGHRGHRSFAAFVRATLPPEGLAQGTWRQLPPAARQTAVRVLLGRDPSMARGAVRVRPPQPPGG